MLCSEVAEYETAEAISPSRLSRRGTKDTKCFETPSPSSLVLPQLQGRMSTTSTTHHEYIRINYDVLLDFADRVRGHVSARSNQTAVQWHCIELSGIRVFITERGRVTGYPHQKCPVEE